MLFPDDEELNARFEQAFIDKGFPADYNPTLNFSLNNHNMFEILYSLVSSRWYEYFNPSPAPEEVEEVTYSEHIECTEN